MLLSPIYAIIAVIGWGGSWATINGWGNKVKGRDYEQYLVGEHNQVSYSNTMITFHSYVYQVLTISSNDIIHRFLEIYLMQQSNRGYATIDVAKCKQSLYFRC
jgi:hypothetical protein